MRACAAVGVVVTHVAFQTGHTGGITGRLFGRFDLAVAVFFALSGFLLWRGHAAAARGLRPRPPTGHYLRSRIVRIMPGYLVAVVVILLLLPDAKADLTVWLANLSLTQIYVPLTLTAGLTQMWSLSVEVAFYLALPLLALLARRLPVRARIPVIAAVAVASLGMGADPVRRAVRRQPAELAARVLLVVRRGHAAGGVDRHAKSAGRTGWPGGELLMAVIVVVAFLVAASPLAGPEGLTPGTRQPIHREDRDGRGGRGGTDRPAGAGPPRHPAPTAGQHDDGDAGPMVLRVVHLAPGRAGDGVPRHR